MPERLIRLFLPSLLFFASAECTALAGDQAENPRDSTYRSECNIPINQSWARNANQLNPWLKNIEITLKERPEYRELKNAFLSDSHISLASCCFQVEENGQMQHLKTLAVSGSSSFDAKLIRFIEGSKIFPIPPNQLAYSHGVEVFITKYKKHVLFSVGLRAIPST